MPSSTTHRTLAPGWSGAGQCSLDAAGICNLKLRRRLLQQQLRIVDDKCSRLTHIVAKKQSAKNLRAREPMATQGDEVAEQAFDRGGRLNGRAGMDFVGGGRRLDSVGVRETDDITGNALCGKTHEQQQGLLAPMPFRRGSRIDFNKKKHILRGKQREMEREKNLEQRRRQNHPPKVDARDEVAIEPSIFPDRYMKGEVPCSRHCSAGKTAGDDTRPLENRASFPHSKVLIAYMSRVILTSIATLALPCDIRSRHY